MSGLKVVSYRDVIQERQRREAQELEQFRRSLQRCAQISRALGKVDDREIPGLEGFEELSAAGGGPSALSTQDRNAWLSRFPEIEKALSDALIAARERRVRLEFAAQGLLVNANASEREVLQRCLRDVRHASPDEFRSLIRDIQSIVTARTFASNSPRAVAAISAETARLAEALMGPSYGLSSTNPASSNVARDGAATAYSWGPAIQQLIAALAELGEGGDDLTDEARRMLGEVGATDFQMRLDSLSMRGAERLNALRQQVRLVSEAAAASGALAPFTDIAAVELRDTLERAVLGRDAGAVRKVSEDIRKWVAETTSARDGETVRRALLEGLQDLGYEVRSQIDAWRPGETISISKPNEPNYDVEMLATRGGRIQSKVRAYDHPGRSGDATLRDIEVEQNWCAELKSLNDRLENKGFAARIEVDQPPGFEIQKPIQSSSEAFARRTLPPRSRQRS